MIRSLAAAHIASFRLDVVANLMQRIARSARADADARRLDTLPRDRLEDMGIAPTTDANFRSSGQSGPLPRTTLW